MVHHFNHRDGVLFAEDVNLNDLADQVGTPFYVYSSATLRRHVRVVRDAFDGIPTLIAYAMKANSNQAVLKLMASEGCGADVVSLGELERVLAAGFAELEHYYRPAGLPREEQPWLASVWRKG